MSLRDWQEESISNVIEEYCCLSDENLKAMTKDILEALSACDEYASYSTGGHNQQAEDIKALQREIERERNKRICNVCKGKGTITQAGPYHCSVSDCCNCRGIGFVYYEPWERK